MFGDVGAELVAATIIDARLHVRWVTLAAPQPPGPEPADAKVVDALRAGQLPAAIVTAASRDGPSGHVLEALTILGFVAIRVWRAAWALAVRLAVAILVVVDVVPVGAARMALGAHYPTDVLAGFFGGPAALGLYAWFTSRGAWADKPRRTRARPMTHAECPRWSPSATRSATCLR